MANKNNNKNAKILALDIETRPAKAYVWRMWDQNVSVDQLIDPGGTICFCANWVGSREFMFHADWEDGHEGMIRAAHALISEADAVITYNGDKFDLPKLMGEFLLYGLTPPPPQTSIDVLKTVRKMGFVMNKLAYIGPLLKQGAKIKNEGFTLWTKVMDGDPKAQQRMKKYCIQDVRLLVKLYNHIKPYIKNHPHLGEKATAGLECGACGSDKLHSRGYRRTKSFRIQRIQCQSCGSWQDGKREKLG